MSNDPRICVKLSGLLLALLILPIGALLSACLRRDPNAWMSTASVNSLIQALGDSNPSVRTAAAWELADRGSAASAAVPVLRATLDDPHSHRDLKIAVITALGNIGPAAASATPELTDMLASDDADISSLAANALSKIGPVAAAAIPGLRQALLTNTDHGVKVASIQALIAIGGASQSVNEFIFVLNADDDRYVRIYAARGLAAAATDAACAVPFLVKQLNDSDPYTREVSAEAIAQITGEVFREPILDEQGEALNVIDAKQWWDSTGSQIEWPPCS